MLSIGLTTNDSSSSKSISSPYSSLSNDHCYTKPPQRKEQNKRTAAQRKRQGQTFLTPTNNDYQLQGLTTTSTSAPVHVSSNNTQDLEFQEGDNVLLIQFNDERSVARGQVSIARGRCLHGRDVPAELTVVSIKEVWDKTCPLQFHTAFDEEDDVLTPGMITAWPTRLLQKL